VSGAFVSLARACSTRDLDSLPPGYWRILPRIDGLLMAFLVAELGTRTRRAPHRPALRPVGLDRSDALLLGLDTRLAVGSWVLVRSRLYGFLQRSSLGTLLPVRTAAVEELRRCFLLRDGPS
jgi:hypothetical protein